MNDLKIGIRLGMGFGIVMVLLLAIVLTATAGLTTLNDKTIDIVNKDWVKIKLVIDALDNVRGSMARVFEFTAVSDRQRLKHAEDRFNANSRIFHAAIEKLTSLLQQREGKELLEKSREHGEMYIASAARVMKLLGEGKREQAAKLAIDETYVALHLVSDDLRAINDFQHRSLEQAARDSASVLASNRRIMIVLSVLALLLSVVFTGWIRRVERVRERLMTQLDLLSERLATSQEDERRKIAYELHEDLGQDLATLKLHLQMTASGSKNQETKISFVDTHEIAAHAAEQVRKLVMNLVPPDLEELGLHAAVRTHCRQRAAGCGWKFHLDVTASELRLPRSLERACFYVLRESLNNVVLHSGATDVWVRLHQSADKLELTVRDNGIGLSAPREDDGRDAVSLGIFAMQMRAKHVGGRVEMRPSGGGGTEIRAEFPLDSGIVEIAARRISNAA